MMTMDRDLEDRPVCITCKQSVSVKMDTPANCSHIYATIMCKNCCQAKITRRLYQNIVNVLMCST